MELARLIDALADPGAYPFPVPTVEVCHTHISVVFLAGPFAYKIKKPVQLGFLDFSTMEKRHHYCQEEVRLNRRLAPSVYLDVVPIGRGPFGTRMEGPGKPAEWAVKMVRLSPEATLRRRLQAGLDTGRLRAIARRIAEFHAQADRGVHVSKFGRHAVVAGNARENFEQSSAQIGHTISQAVFDRLRTLTDACLLEQRPLIEKRAREDRPRDTHGDLHLEHIYLFPDRAPPDDLVIIDCIEFNERFRYADPVADIAFLYMDLIYHGFRSMALELAETYFQTAGDAEGWALLPFYTSYRAAVRGKVEGMKALSPEVPEPQKIDAHARSQAHWLLALGELEEPDRRPGLVLVGGLPGTGKSTLAGGLADLFGFQVLRTDVVRKELAAGMARGEGFGQGIYTQEWTDRTYEECARRAEAMLFAGQRVLIDASFRQERWRQKFLELGRRWAVPTCLFLCQASPKIVRERLASRQGDASDADWNIYLQTAARWEEPSMETVLKVREIQTGDIPGLALATTTEQLRRLNLTAPS